MKYAFYTANRNNLTWKEAITTAKDLGFSGIEIGAGLLDAQPFTSQYILRTAEQLANLNLEISCFSSSCSLNDREKRKENIQQLRELIDIAARMGASFVRLLPDDDIMPNDRATDQAVISAISAILPYAEKKHVILLIDTIGIYCDTDRLRKVLEHFASDNLAALWNVHHPYRFHNESAEKTVQNLGAYIKYVHMKDSLMNDGAVKFTLMGEGDLPVDEIIRALKSVNYDGYIA
ncbi:MAG TPA: sugar phosphate isomerase/epimerase family protein, partial [Clostridia bacterium]|nr:sugar phosphate isomerase/epimerase family protein [Clostridia bacterium]